MSWVLPQKPTLKNSKRISNKSFFLQPLALLACARRKGFLFSFDHLSGDQKEKELFDDAPA